MKRRLLPTLFALPFAGVGIWMLWTITDVLHDAVRMRAWQPVPARIESAGCHTRSGDDNDSYEAYAEYRYTYEGNTYSGDRVGIASGADNIGDYQQETGERLSRVLAAGRTVTVYVDPDHPASSIIDRDVRWGLLGFESIFLLAFGGIGVGLLVFAWRPRSSTSRSPHQVDGAPWQAREAWRNASVRSASQAAMWIAWAFAVLWNLISAPLPFLVWSEVTDAHNNLALVGLVFPLVGAGLLLWAIRRTLEWRRFGPAPLFLDPYPGSIGGHVGGTIELGLPFASARRFDVTLACVRSHVSGSGRDRRRQESAKWQDSRLAHTEPGSRGTRLTFRFDVPTGLPEADAERGGGACHLWRLTVHARLRGADLDRDYDIPVYATATHSSALADDGLEEARDRHRVETEDDLRDLVRVERSVAGSRLHYPAGRRLGTALVPLVAGLVFAGFGGYFLRAGDSLLFGSVFGGVGAAITAACLYLILNSLDVSRAGNDIVSVRRLLGVPVRRQRMPRERFERLEQRAGPKTQSGGRHRIYYAIQAVDRQGRRMTVGDGFRGDSEARAATLLIARELGLERPHTADVPVLPDELLLSRQPVR